MVLWEITLGTAYFLGLKRTYKLALKLQRKLINPKHPKIRQVVHRRTRNVFDVALKVHHKVQERNIEVGRNLGNWFLRSLDKIKPEARIRAPPSLGIKANTNLKKQSSHSPHMTNNDNNKGVPSKYNSRTVDCESDRHHFTAFRNVWPKPFPTIAMMMKPTRSAGHSTQNRQYGTGGSKFFTVYHGKFGFGQVLRNDVSHWIMHH